MTAGCQYTLTEGTFAADGQNGLPDITTPMTIEGNGAIIARGSTDSLPAFRILHVADTGALLLNSVTISYGHEIRGAGIYSTGALTLTNSTLDGNQAMTLADHTFAMGGGVYIGGGTFTALNSTFINNQAQGVPQGLGGGIFLYDGTATIAYSVLTHNTIPWSGGGGGIYVNDGTLEITHSLLRANRSAGSGGGLYASGTVTVTQSAFIENVTVGSEGVTMSDSGGWGRGGAIAVEEGTVMIANTTLTGNQALGGSGGLGTADGGAGGGGQGGALYLFRSVATVSNSTIDGNQAAGGSGGNATIGMGGGGGEGAGGGICLILGTLILSNTTITGNQATGGDGGAGQIGGLGGFGSGGGIDAFDTVTATSSTIADNRASGGLAGAGPTRRSDGIAEGGGIARRDPAAAITVANTIIATNQVTTVGGITAPDIAGAFISQGYNLIGDGTGGEGFTAAGDQVGTTASQIDPRLAPLANNGGPTQTRALLPGSPAIDAGNPAVVGSSYSACPASDQRFSARMGRCDIGAFEVQAAVLQPTMTTLISAQNPAFAGQAITFTATVQPATFSNDTPSGLVTFHDGTALLGSAALDSSGRASLTTTTLAVGMHYITATYSGAPPFTASTSAEIVQVVRPITLFLPMVSQCDVGIDLSM